MKPYPGGFSYHMTNAMSWDSFRYRSKFCQHFSSAFNFLRRTGAKSND